MEKQRCFFKFIIVCIICLSAVSAAYAAEVDILADSGRAGNIFYSGEEVCFDIALSAGNYLYESLSADVLITNEDGSEVYSSQGRVVPHSMRFEVKPDNLLYGTYNMKVSVRSGQECVAEEIFSFSKVQANTVLNDKLGVCSHYMLTHYNRYANMDEVNLNLIAKAGFGMVRENASWSVYETQKEGGYSLPTKWKDYMKNATDRGIAVLPIFCGGNQLYGGNYPPYTPDDIKAFSDYAADFAKKAAEIGIYDFEIWNEYDLSAKRIDTEDEYLEKAKYYVNMMQSVYDKVTTAVPQARLIGCVTSGVPENWLREVFRLVKEGNEPCFDIISVHPYLGNREPSEQDEVYAAVKNINQWVRGAELSPCEIWATEFGWSTYSQGVSEKEQANNLVKAYVVAQAENLVEKMFWYQMADGMTADDNIEYNYGLLNTIEPTDGSVPLSAKTAYVAAANLNRLLTGKEFVSKYTVNGVTVYQFEEKSGGVFVLLGDGNNVQVPISVSERAVVCDLYGNETELETENGVAAVDMTDDVVYVREMMNTKFEPYYHKGTVTLTGQLSGGYSGQLLSVMVYRELSDPVGSMVYLDQMYADSRNQYEITFGLGKKLGNYFVKTSYDTAAGVIEENFVYGRGMNGVTFRAKSFDDIDGAITADIWLDRQGIKPESFSVIFAAYNDGVLKKIDVQNATTAELQDSAMTKQSYIDITEADELRLFCWDKTNGIVPLAEVDCMVKSNGNEESIINE